MVEIATRVYNHNWKIDPIVRSILDNDFYKLLMAQSIFRRNVGTRVTFSLINRTKDVPLAEMIAAGKGAPRLPFTVRCRWCGAVGRLQVRPPMPMHWTVNGWMLVR